MRARAARTCRKSRDKTTSGLCLCGAPYEIVEEFSGEYVVEVQAENRDGHRQIWLFADGEVPVCTSCEPFPGGLGVYHTKTARLLERPDGWHPSDSLHELCLEMPAGYKTVRARQSGVPETRGRYDR